MAISCVVDFRLLYNPPYFSHLRIVVLDGCFVYLWYRLPPEAVVRGPQALDLRRLAEQRGFEIVHEYTDKISGTKAN